MTSYTFQNGDPLRLDLFVVSKLPDLSRSYIKYLATHGKIMVNGEVPQKSGLNLRTGDVVDVHYDQITDEEIPIIDLPILYEDDDCVVVEKPAGLLTHSKGAFNPEATIATFIEPRLKDYVGDRAGIVHRLDRITSGVIICAKTAAAHTHLQKQFSIRKTKKTYMAVVEGKLEPTQAIIDMPIERNPKKPQTFRVGANGKTAQTAYKVLESNDTYSLVELKPHTGRTHQLRVHMANQGHPIVGDTLYGAQPAERVFLHAAALEITLPNRERKVFESPVPASFKALLS